MSNIVIIGASSGIGLEITNLLSINENQVYATYFKTDVQNNKSNVHYSFLDVTEAMITILMYPILILPEIGRR